MGGGRGTAAVAEVGEDEATRVAAGGDGPLARLLVTVRMEGTGGTGARLSPFLPAHKKTSSIFLSPFFLSQAVEFESTAFMPGSFGVRLSLVAYPVITVARSFLDACAARLRGGEGLVGLLEAS